MSGTIDPKYADRLERLSGLWWKRVLDVQRPYRWNLRRLGLGRTLEVGCGVGRNLKSLQAGSVGIDHNPQCVEAAKSQGLAAYTPEEFFCSPNSSEQFDSLLLAHVLEHVAAPEADALLGTYLSFLRPGGQVVMITPQEAGYRSDPTHVRFVDFHGLRVHAEHVGVAVSRIYSFPFPRWVGRYFPYNEFVCVATWPSPA